VGLARRVKSGTYVGEQATAPNRRKYTQRSFTRTAWVCLIERHSCSVGRRDIDRTPRILPPILGRSPKLLNAHQFPVQSIASSYEGPMDRATRAAPPYPATRVPDGEILQQPHIEATRHSRASQGAHGCQRGGWGPENGQQGRVKLHQSCAAQ